MSLKYRLLSGEELSGLEKEFIDFLVVNGIAAEDWVRMKKEQPQDAERMIELFSDVVFEGILRKTHYLEFRTRNDIKTFHCAHDKIILMGIEGPEEIDFTDPSQLQKAMASPPKGVSIYTMEKAYQKTRELEIFEMTENGCMISEGQLFKALTLAYYDKKK